MYLDEDDGALQRELDGFRGRRLARSGYQCVTRPLPGGMFYWHLYHQGERVNGGLSESRDAACEASGYAVTRHMHETGGYWR